MRFGSDNQAGVSPAILQALVEAAQQHSGAYGNDDWTVRAQARLGEVFEQPLDAFFVATGTAANCLALAAITPPWGSVLCHADAHIINDESTAPEFFTGGARLVPVETASGKLLAEDLRQALARWPDIRPHSVLPSAVSITQASECGLVYTPDEIGELCALAHQHGLHVHMDGARFANAVATLQCSPAAISGGAGIDVLTLGASKNGALAGESVLFFNRALAVDFDIRRKRAGQLVSKGRLFGAQFEAWLANDHWLDLARHANAMASALGKTLADHPAIRLAWPVEANEVFAVIDSTLLATLREHGLQCYDWTAVPDMASNEATVRLVTSWTTTAAEVTALSALLQGA